MADPMRIECDVCRGAITDLRSGMLRWWARRTAEPNRGLDGRVELVEAIHCGECSSASEQLARQRTHRILDGHLSWYTGRHAIEHGLWLMHQHRLTDDAVTRLFQLVDALRTHPDPVDRGPLRWAR